MYHNHHHHHHRHRWSGEREYFGRLTFSLSTPGVPGFHPLFPTTETPLVVRRFLDGDLSSRPSFLLSFFWVGLFTLGGPSRMSSL